MIDLTGFGQEERPEQQSGDFQPIPEGTYQCVIDRVEVRKTAAGDNMLSITNKITGPNHAGRLLFDNLNLWHSNSATACEIALATLWQIHDACGLKSLLADAEELVNRNVDVRVVVEPHWDKDKAAGGEKLNRIKKYISPANSTQGKAEGSAPAKGGAKMPWEK